MKNAFSLNLKSLAFFRVFLGLVFVCDILTRLFVSDIFYTDNGVLSRSFLIQNLELPGKLTLLNLNGSEFFANTFFLVAIFCGISFILGIRTKVFSILCWIILCSVSARNPHVGHGGDNLLRLAFFWAMFLPIGARYSLDRFFNDSKEAQEPTTRDHYSIFTIGFILQICFIYWFTFLYKLDPRWYAQLSSTYYAFSLDSYTTFVAQYLLNFPNLLKFLTICTLILEGIGPLILFIPLAALWKRRLVTIALFWGLHIGIWLTLHLGNFPPACLAVWLIFIPEEFWQYIRNKLPTGNGLTIFYDKDCGFCRKMAFAVRGVFFLKDADIQESTNDSKAHKLLEKEYSWVCKKDEDYRTKYHAFLLLFENSLLKPFLPLLAAKPIAYLGKLVYELIAKYRAGIGTLLESIGTSKTQYNHFNITKVFGLFSIIMIFSWNVEGLVGSKNFDIRSPFNEFVFTFQLNQQWNMFAPSPMKNDGWFITRAQLRDGKEWDILNDKQYTQDLPKDMSDYYPDSLWRKYLFVLKQNNRQSMRLNFARFMCRKWNNENINKVETFDIFFMKQRTPPPGQKQSPIEVVKLWNHNCFK